MQVSEEEIKNKAWETLNRALDYIEIPDNVKVDRKEDGTFSFLLMLSYESTGSAVIYFKPSIKIIVELLKLTQNQDTNDTSLPYALREQLNYNFAEVFGYVFIKNFFAEIKETLSGLNEIPFLIPMMLMAEITDDSNVNKINRTKNTKVDLKKLLEKRKQATKKRIQNEIEIANKSGQPAKHLISHYYEDLLPKWERAKDFYRKNKSFENWEQMVTIGFEGLPTDLVHRLGDSDTYISMPSSIGLEHAARICGIKPNSIGLRGLQNYLQQSRDWAKKEGVENVDKEVGRYFREVLSEVITGFKVAFWNKDNDHPFEKYSLLHQMIAEVSGDKIKKIIEADAVQEISNELQEDDQIH